MKKLSLLMFSGDYDKALAGLILANSAKELDMEVSMFFAFWGLLLVRDPNKATMEQLVSYIKYIRMYSNMYKCNILFE